MELSYSCAGHFFLYFVGVHRAFTEVFTKEDLDSNDIFHEYSGCSSGTVAAAAGYFSVPWDRLMDTYVQFFGYGKKVGMVDMCSLVPFTWDRDLPKNTEEVISNSNKTLTFFMNRLTPRSYPRITPVCKSDMKTRLEVIQYGSAACHLPLLAGSVSTEVDKKWFFDGLSYKPGLDPNKSILVTPYEFMAVYRRRSSDLCISPSVWIPSAWSMKPYDEHANISLVKLGYYDAKVFIKEHIDMLCSKLTIKKQDQYKSVVNWNRYIDHFEYTHVQSTLRHARFEYIVLWVVYGLLSVMYMYMLAKLFKT